MNSNMLDYVNKIFEPLNEKMHKCNEVIEKYSCQFSCLIIIFSISLGSCTLIWLANVIMNGGQTLIP